MSEPLTFRTRYDTTLFLLGVLALAGALVSMFSDFALLPGRGYAYACEPWRLHSVVWGSFAAMCIVVCAAQWKRLVIGEECLERHGLLRTRVVLWVAVTEVTLGPLGRFGRPGIMLRAGQRRWRWWRREPWACRLAITAAFQDYERLVREILARIPHAKVTEGVRRGLTEPLRVGWLPRLPATLLALGVLSASVWSLATFGESGSPFDVLWRLRRGPGGLYLGPLLAAGVLVSLGAGPLAAGPLARDWRWKPALMSPCALLLFCACTVAIAPGDLFGVWGPCVLVCACSAAWSLGSLALCLPWRPRWWQAVCVHAACLTAALALVWHHDSRSPIPCRRTPQIAVCLDRLRWSTDGRLLCCVGRPAFDAPPRPSVYHVVNARTLEVQSYPDGLPDIALGSYRFTLTAAPAFAFVDGRHVLCPGPLKRVTATAARMPALCVVDATSGVARPVFSAIAGFRVAHEGATSPDGTEVVFVAVRPGGSTVHVLRLSDLAVHEVLSSVVVSRFNEVRYRADGGLLFVEDPRFLPPNGVYPKAVAFWALAADSAQPTLLHRAQPGTWPSGISPNGRWALLWIRPDTRRERHAIVDLLAGTTRTYEPLGRVTGFVAWARDGGTVAYLTQVGAGLEIVTVDPRAARVRTRCPMPDWGAAGLALSCDGRFAAYIGAPPLRRVCIAELATGRIIRLPHSLGTLGYRFPLWSPTEPRLAVALYDTVFPRRTSRLYIFEPDRG